MYVYISVNSTDLCLYPLKFFVIVSIYNDIGERMASNVRRRPITTAGDEMSDSSSSSSKTNSSEENEGLNNDSDVTAKEQIGIGHRLTDEPNGQNADRQTNVLQYAYRPCTPAHNRIKESPLSSDAIFKQSHAGLFNLCIVVLVAVNSRLIIENVMKYGLLINTNFWFSSRSLRDWPLLMCCLSLPIFPLAAYIVEKFAWRKRISDSAVVTLHVIITTIALLYPVFVILRFDSAVLSGVTLMLFACVNWLKLVSFVHANYDMRLLVNSTNKEEEKPGPEYFYDVNLNTLAYFMVAPTLCYQTSYPRSPCIRKGWVLRQTIKFIIFTGVMGFIIEQYINPIVRNSRHPLKGDFLYAVERVLKLSVPNLYVWLCMFYCFFHLWLNILAEVLRFGDREFYKDWWNAQTVDEYWRRWNMPVHRWIVRHIYFPCIRRGIPKGGAHFIAFFTSAVFHELCIAVPCHIFKFWAFLGIMLQIWSLWYVRMARFSPYTSLLALAVPVVPLVLLTDFFHRKFQNSMVGNMMFWFFFSILGQPMSVLLCYHDLMNRESQH